MILVTSRCCCFISAHHDMTWLCSGTGGLCFQCVAETSGRNGSVRHQCCHQLGPWRCSTGGSSEAVQRLAKTRSQSAGPVHHCVTDKVWGWHWLSRWCYCSIQANANKELWLVELWFKKKRFCLSDRPHLLLLFLHLTTSDLGFLLFFYVSDMKTRKWSFSLEDYKQLSKCVCLCVFFLGDICHLVWPCCVPYPVDRLSGIAAVEVEPLPRALIQAFSARFEGRTDAMAVDVPVADLSTIDPTLTSSLMPFQREGVK